MTDLYVLDVNVRETGLSRFVDDLGGISRMCVLYVDAMEVGQVVKGIELRRDINDAPWQSEKPLPAGLLLALDEFMESDAFEDYWDAVHRQLWDESPIRNET